MSTASAPATGGFTESTLSGFLAARDEPGWLADRRRSAFSAFGAIPWPTLRDEEWRRTDIRALRLTSFAPPANASPSAEARDALRPSWDALNANYASGIEHLDSALTRPADSSSLPPGVVFTDLASAAKTHPELIEKYLLTKAVDPSVDALSALHAAFWTGGTLLYVPKGVTVEAPLFGLVGLPDRAARI